MDSSHDAVHIMALCCGREQQLCRIADLRSRWTVSHHFEHLHRLFLRSSAGLDAMEGTDELAPEDYSHVPFEPWNIVSSYDKIQCHPIGRRSD
jgi:hypothetical protein